MEKTYFERPKQVVFADPENPGEWLVGIAFHHNIICACCGGVFDIDEVIELAHEDGRNQAIYPYEDWVDITDEIAGGCLPEGLEYSGINIVEVVEDESNEDYEQHYFFIEDDEPVEEVFANTLVNGVAMPSVD